MISNTVQKLNTIFNVQLLISMIITFCQINLDLYIYLIKWHDGLVINLNGQASKLFLSTTIFYIIKLVLIVWACETGKNQAQEIRITIHDVLNKAKDKQIKNELQSFSLQILHCKNIFSAKGFNMDAMFLTTMMDMLYINCVCLLKACFKDVNNNLQQMEELIINSESRVPMLFYYKQKNLFLIMKLKILKKQHMMISNTVQMLNTIFSMQLLASTIITFGQISLDLYIHLFQWHDGVFINLNGQFSEFILSDIIYYIIKLALIVWACETCKNQAQEIRTTIHDVLNSTKDEQIKNEV
ncbi:PREDICTED: uncharacterized protein LOC105627026 [Atta cephalotes]|uniref:Gustatory receptor n=1 Tax=Atta cephalotes TaxID=12957 RepID=A0A158P1N8_ATTCE|nr:PREDICTED: uncharacterized protein LOC105627026 [Atta cephalotes]